jgi:predicted Zn-dependent protease
MPLPRPQRIGARALTGAVESCRRWAARGRRHPRQAVLAVVLLAACLGGAGYWVGRDLTAQAHFRAARQSLALRKWSEARTHLTACLRTWPDRAEAHLLAARAARRLGLLEEAEERLETCGHLQGEETPEVQVERALLRLSRGDLAGTEAFLRGRVAGNDPDAVEILDVLSRALLLDRRLPEAHRCLDDLLRRQPDDFDVLVRHAATAAAQGWESVAVQSLQKAVDLRPDAHGLRLSLAQNLAAVGRFPEALGHLAHLRACQPDDPAVTFALARCLAWSGRVDQAAPLLDGLLEREPDNWSVLSERGWLCLQLDQPARAEAYLRRAQSLAPPNQALLTRLSDCLRLLGKHAEARPFREQAEQLRAATVRSSQLAQRIRDEKPADPDLYHELACLYLLLGREPDALYYFREALRRDPQYPPTHESLARLRAGSAISGQAASAGRFPGADR